MASGHRKPNNFFVIPPGTGAAFVANLPIEKFHGVGPATAARMRALGIGIGADLAALTLEEMTEKFGRSAEYWFDLSRGVDHREVNPNRERKSVGAEDTFRDDIRTIEEARALTAPLVEKVWRICETRGLWLRTVTLKVKSNNFEQITRSRSAGRHLREKGAFNDVFQTLLAAEFPPELPIRLLGVTASGFGLADEEVKEQLTLVV